MNASGITPIEYNVLVRPDEVQEKTKGGLIIPDEARERDEYAGIKGTVVAVSALAYTRTASGDAWEGPKPEPGSRVLFARYAGTAVDGQDGVKYRLMKDENVVALIHE